MKKKFIFRFIIFLIIFYFIFNIFIIGGESFYNIKQLIPDDKKKLIKKYLFPYKYIQEIEKQSDLREKLIEHNIKQYKDYESRLSKKDQFIASLPEKIGFGEFYKIDQRELKINNVDFIYTEFKDDFLEIKKNQSARSGSVYAEKFQDKIIIMSGDGYFQYFTINNLNEEKFKSKIIKSNIKELINYDLFFENSMYGVKDLFLMDNQIYFSYINEVKDNCYNTSIMRAEINFEILIFKDFFAPSECIINNYEGFEPGSSGGRMAKLDDKIIFSIGEYLSRDKAQDENSIFGKVFILDPKNKDFKKLAAMGHRNVQGLIYDDENKSIISTEHGPKGGDEVNINKNFFNSKINNYGWPISSYGEHYTNSIKAYKKYPFHKSHSKYGFIEPVKYFVPSIGISQIVKMNNFFNSKENNSYLIGALGNDPAEGDLSLHYIQLSENLDQVKKHEIFFVNNRVRDLIIIDEKNILSTLETNSTIGHLKIKN